jgi:hypothetical protein
MGTCQGRSSMPRAAEATSLVPLVAMAYGTDREERTPSSSRAPGRGATHEPVRGSRADNRARVVASRVVPVSRWRALRKSPPLMPIRRWTRHTDRGIPHSVRASCQAVTAGRPSPPGCRRGRRGRRGPAR